MVASSIDDSGATADKKLIDEAAIRTEAPGSDRYQKSHMAQIFQEGLSFSGFERNKLFLGRADRSYQDLSAVCGADTDGDCRATLLADFDDDGDHDIFVNAIQRDLHMLYRNNAGPATGNFFVKIRLQAKSGHPDAIGAVVKVTVKDGSGHERTQAQVLSCGTGFESQNAPELIYGLGSGKDATVTVAVRWPGRQVESFGTLQANGRYLLVEGAGKAQSYAKRTFRFPDAPPRGLRIAVGEKLATLELQTLDDKPETVRLAGGKPVLLNFWATTCASCVKELPQLAKLHTSGKYRVVAVSFDPASRRAAMESWWSKLKLPFESFRISDEVAANLFDMPRLGIPLSIVVAPDGKITRVIQGAIREGEL